MEKLSEQHEALIEELESHGWCQGAYMDDDGKLCLAGGLYSLSCKFAGHQYKDHFTDHLPNLHEFKVRPLLRDMEDTVRHEITAWNDSHTWEEVRDMLMGRAKELRDEGK